MRERPILFSAPMVRALLDGTKTQTRRVVKPQPFDDGYYDGDVYGALRYTHQVGSRDDVALALFSAEAVGGGASRTESVICPYGIPGDRLWVKEAIRCFEWMDGGETSVEYVATPGVMHDDAEWVWKRNALPGMFMPRGLSRITLEITDVRVERLQEITHGDAVAEGMLPLLLDIVKNQAHPLRAATFARGRDIPLRAQEADGYGREEGEAHPDGPFAGSVEAYSALWDSLNKTSGFGWDANPWVWVVSFRQLAIQTQGNSCA